MADNLRWVFELYDKLSGPADRMAKSLEAVDAKLTKVAKSMEETEKSVQDSESSWGRLFSTIDHGLGIISRLGGLAVDAGRKVAGLGVDFFEAGIDAASFKESTSVALSTILGSQAAADRVLNNVVQIASKLPITTQAAMGYASSAILSGFSEKELPHVLTAIGDIGALSPDRPDLARDVFSRYINEIKQQGMSGRHLMYLARETRLPEEQILEQLSKTLHLDKGFIKKHLGDIDHDDALNSIFTVLANKQGGQIGNLSGRLSQTLGGLMTTLRSRKLEFLMDLDTGPAYKSVRGFIKNMTDALDPGGTFGAGLKGRVADIFNSMFEPLFGQFAGKDGLGRIEEVLSTIMDIAEMGGNGFTAFVKGVLDALGVTGKLKVDVHSLDSSLHSLGVGMGNFITYLKSDGLAEGADILKGIATALGIVAKITIGWTHGFPMMISDAITMTTGSQAEKSALMDEISGREAQERARGVARMKSGDVSEDMLTPLKRSPPSITVNQNVHVNGHADPQEVKRKAHEATVEALRSSFEQMAIEQGAQ